MLPVPFPDYDIIMKKVILVATAAGAACGILAKWLMDKKDEKKDSN